MEKVQRASDMTYLCIDFSVNRETVKTGGIVSNSLESQFSNMIQYNRDDFDDFLRDKFCVENTTVFISYPNFERKPRIVEKPLQDGNIITLTYYKNVALRFPQGKENDLVLMGDVMEKSNGHRVFNVKTLLSMDKNIEHYGETELKCSTVIRIAVGANWETMDWGGERLTNDYILASTLTNDVMVQIHDSYVVPNFKEVNNIFEEWNNYLASRRYLLEKDKEKSYKLDNCTPELLVAYYTEITGKKINKEDFRTLKYLKESNSGYIWTKDRIDQTSEEHLLLHLYTEYPEHEYLAKKDEKTNLKKSFDFFTKGSVELIGQKRKDREQSEELPVLGNKIASSFPETVEPLKELERIDKTLDDRIKKLEIQQGKALNAEISRRIAIYKNTQLPQLIEDYLKEQKGAVFNRIETACNNNIVNSLSKLSKKDKELKREMDSLKKESENIENKISKINAEITDLQNKNNSDDVKKQKKNNSLINDRRNELSRLEKKKKAVDADYDSCLKRKEQFDREEAKIMADNDAESLSKKELDRLGNEYGKQLIAEEEERLRKELEIKYKRETNKAISDIKYEIEESKNDAKKKMNIVRFHVYFEIELEEGADPHRLQRSYSNLMTTGMKLKRSQAKEVALLKVQQKALDNLRMGEVLNPFLTTFLFSPNSRGKSKTKKIDHFFIQNLNDSQKEAVEKALSSNGLFLIQGPPGTGKTHVIAEITAQLAASGRKVLISSQNNKAVDNAFGRIPKIPMIRPMRLLSFDMNKVGNEYSMDNLLQNFYRNISESMESEIDKIDHRQKIEHDLNGFISGLEDDLDSIAVLQSQAKGVSKEIKEVEKELDDANNKKKRMEDSNYKMEESIEKRDGDIQSVREFADEGTVKKLKRLLGDIGFDPSEYGDVQDVLRSIYKTGYDEISDEYSKMIEHREYFELKEEKEKCKDPKKIVNLGNEIRYYCEDNNFDEKESLPFLSSFKKIPHDKKLILECKEIVDDTVARKLSSLEEAQHESANDIQDLTGVKNEIDRLKKRIEELKSDHIYQKLSEAENNFDIKGRDIFKQLHINTICKKREDVIDELKRERKRIKEEYSSNKTEMAERKEAYKRMSKYISNEEVISEDKVMYNPELLKLINVIGMTCSLNAYQNLGDDNTIDLKKLNIDVVIIDEVSKLPLVELLHPILLGKTVILVGDHKQLPPMYNSCLDKKEENPYDPDIISFELEEKYKKMYESSFFARLFEESPDCMKSALTIQYRMHPDIMDADNVFYRDNPLSFGGNVVNHKHYLNITGSSGKNILDDSNHILFIDVGGREMRDPDGTSFYNEEEVRTVLKLLDMLNNNCRADRFGNKLSSDYRPGHDDRLSLGVICTYSTQAKKIRKGKQKAYRSFNKDNDEPFMIKSVDDFQGDERDIIILSMVRTTPAQFLRDYRRINVAISRARRLLIIVGKKSNLDKMTVEIDGKHVPVYRDLIRSIERKGGVIPQSAITGEE